MTDIFSRKKRSDVMSKIRSTGTKPELAVRELLDGRVFRYQPGIYGSPDFGNKTRKIAIFIDGCFWHTCPKCYRKPKSNIDFWEGKIRENRTRDRRVNRELHKRGFAVMRFWEHDVIKNPLVVTKKILNGIENG